MSRKIGDKVTLEKGTKIGMGTLKYSVEGTICNIQQSENGTDFYGVRFTDKYGDERVTWIS